MTLEEEGDSCGVERHSHYRKYSGYPSWRGYSYTWDSAYPQLVEGTV